MLSFLKRLFGRKNQARNIFRYWDGERQRGLDPLAAWRVMWTHPTCDPPRDFPAATGRNGDGSPFPFDMEAEERVLEMAREMFGVKGWSEDCPGLTVEETFALLFRFMDYMNDIKKKRESLQTRSEPSTQESFQPAISPTNSESESYSTQTESKNDAPL